MSQNYSIKALTKSLFIVAYPAVLNQIFQISLGITDVFIASQKGSDTLAAVGMAHNTFVLLYVALLGFFVAINPIIANYDGAQNKEKVRESFQMGLTLAFVVGCVFIVGIRELWRVVSVFNSVQDLMPGVQSYLKGISVGFPLYMSFCALSYSNEGLQQTRPVMITSFLAIPVNAVLSYWFLHGGYGLEPMGEFGIGFATSCVRSFMFVVLLFLTLRNRQIKHFKLFSQWRFIPEKKLFRSFVALGKTTSLSFLLEVSLFAICGILIGRLSNEAVAANQILGTFTAVTFISMFGLSMALSSKVGHCYGKRDFHGVKLFTAIGIVMALISLVITILLCVIFRTGAISFFTKDTHLFAMIYPLVLFVIPFQIIDGIQIIMSSVLKGIKQTETLIPVSFLCYGVIGISLGFYWGEISGLGLRGYWLAYTVAMICATSIYTVILYKKGVISLKKDFYRLSR